MRLKRIHDASVGSRLTAAFGLLIALLMGTVIFGITRLSVLNQSVEFLENQAQARVLSTTLVAHAREISGALGRAVMAESMDVIQANLKEVNAIREDSDKSKQALEGLLASEAGRALLSELDAAKPVYKASVEKVLEAIKSGDTDAARSALNDKSMRKVETQYLEVLTRLDRYVEEAMTAASHQSTATYLSSRTLLLAAAGISVVMGLMLGAWMTRSLLKQLGGEPAQAAALASAVAQGDLSVEIHIDARDRTSLMAQLKVMRDSLSKVVNEVRQHAEAVASASEEIAQGNQDLSHRTEEQASALQQTASSMQTLGSTVRLNADNAKQANQLAHGASAVAQIGGDVVGQVVDTMRGINDSSRKIADIIGVIDGIAFQTNILALNAAVEAARAGEQGRGFAVVASEVRSLAQRSADAAKEIKSLIGVSVERVTQGTALVDQAGSTMGEIVQSIERVTQIMAEISVASEEQSRGVAQVGEAVERMDTGTQQNAALVEESAAAAENLKNRAQQLVRAVAVFRTA